MDDPLDNMVPPGEEGFGIHILATGGEEWSYLDGPDPRKSEIDWSEFDPQRSHLTTVAQFIGEMHGNTTPGTGG
jgi:hypothetical protein